MRQTAKVRFKFRIATNRKVKKAQTIVIGKTNVNLLILKENLATWYKFTFAVNVTLNLSIIKKKWEHCHQDRPDLFKIQL